MRSGSLKSDLEKLRALCVDLVGRDLFNLLVVRLVDDLLPILAIRGSLDGVTIGGVIFLPENTDVLNVRRFLELHLQPLTGRTARRTPARAWVAVDGVLRKVAFVRLLGTRLGRGAGGGVLGNGRYCFIFFFFTVGLLPSVKDSSFGCTIGQASFLVAHRMPRAMKWR